MAISKTSGAPRTSPALSTPNTTKAKAEVPVPKPRPSRDEFGKSTPAAASLIDGSQTRPRQGITRTLQATPTQQPQLAAAGATEAAGATTPASLNSRLDGITPSGASARTARQDRISQGGVGASEQMARTDQDRVMRHRETFEELGAKHDLPPALLAAIASRETRGGNVLDRNGYGDHGNGFGLMQVDKRYHDLQGTDSPTSFEHLDQASGILADFHRQIQSEHPDWTPEQQLQGAVAAYNKGPGRVTDPSNFDRGTTGGDYSNDVIARAQLYAANWN